ncbi:unnamed protein product [Urochloa humidicola]
MTLAPSPSSIFHGLRPSSRPIIPPPPFPALAMAAAACVEAAAAPRHPGAQPTRKRMRVAMGTTEDYEETRCLGEGSFGAVVKARHRVTGENVAIKRLDAAVGSHAVLLCEHLFLDACAGNPFVVRSRGLARDPATAELCLVMDYAGPSLEDILLRLQRRRPHGHGSRPPPLLPEATVRAAMRQLLAGARGMHDDAHVIHRDIKPGNILVEDNRVLRLCDFGLAVSTVSDPPPPYEPAGTPWYMAPEMLLGKPDYDARVDAWSIGCVMAELVGGSAPFQVADDEAQLCKIFAVLGLPDDRSWPWFSSTEFAAEVVPDLDERQYRHNHLREDFPESMLSKEGFEVLSGLLTCNPEKRLTAAAALKLPWFDKMDELELMAKKDEVVSPLPKRPRLQDACVI